MKMVRGGDKPSLIAACVIRQIGSQKRIWAEDAGRDLGRSVDKLRRGSCHETGRQQPSEQEGKWSDRALQPGGNHLSACLPTDQQARWEVGRILAQPSSDFGVLWKNIEKPRWEENAEKKGDELISRKKKEERKKRISSGTTKNRGCGCRCVSLS